MDATQNRCIKFLIIFNIVLSVFGAVIVAIGVWLKLTTSQVITTLSYVTSQLSTKDLFDIPIFLKYASTIIISAGLYAIFISLFGFCGAMMRMKYLLYVYALILFASLLLQVGLGILGLVHKDKIVARARHAIFQSLRETYRGPGATGEHKDYSSSVDFLQVALQLPLEL
ncbi:CD82 antigen-like isoform X2 [Pomacea canaliculata]|uniref:CD82 antigen-like isoform X2 n=1 Tax=Pomacea canaliculata TaxID=400727 RepID=UPI000D73EFE8|nr:CD82 antigen-like isoform X2 [Pomacea canaliculata]